MLRSGSALICKINGRGSIPLVGLKIYTHLAQLVRAKDSKSLGYQFKSDNAYLKSAFSLVG